MDGLGRGDIAYLREVAQTLVGCGNRVMAGAVRDIADRLQAGIERSG